MKRTVSIIVTIALALSFFSFSALDLFANPEIWDGTVASGFAGGDGTEESPFIIENAAQLAYLAKSVNSGNKYLDLFIKLVSDIVLNDTSAENWTDSARSWITIGSSAATNFYGTFDGDNHTVKGLFINSSNKNQGLFGYSSGTVKNIGVIDSVVVGSKNVGGVVGYSYEGTVENCYNTGTVRGGVYTGGVIGHIELGAVTDCHNTGSVSGEEALGGIEYSEDIGGGYVGGVTGISFMGTLEGCYNTGSVSGTDTVGGVIGYGSAKDCYNTGEVNGTDTVGGIIGFNMGIAYSCYNTGNISGINEVGGVAGYNYSDSSRLSIVINCRNTGSVSGTDTVGGVVGTADGKVINCYNTNTVTGRINVGGVAGQGIAANCYNTGTVIGDEFVGGITGGTYSEDCYYLTGCADIGLGSTEADTDGLATALTDEQMKSSENFVSFDFENIWAFEPDTEYAYPQLITLFDKSVGEQSAVWDGTVASGFAGGDGSETSPYTIETASQLAYLAESVNSGDDYSDKFISLTNDITLNDNTKKCWILNASASTPIGNKLIPFNGTFDGNGHEISGLYIDSLSYDQGLFGYSIGTIKNVGVVKSYVFGDDGVGSVAGGSEGSVSYCYSDGFVCGNYDAGGVVGYGGAEYCYNTGTVVGGDFIGGVVGYNYYETVSNCYNAGTVNGGDYIGGVVGYDDGAVTNCYNAGTVSGNYEVGGVVGCSDKTVEYCYNTGTVSGCCDIGGVVGFGITSHCFNTGAISGIDYIGGVSASTIYLTDEIDNCHNDGTVSGREYVGGVSAGSNARDSYNTGTITGTYAVGGISGRGEIKNSYNTGKVDGNEYVGGIVGGGYAMDCYNTGKIDGNENVGGISGCYAAANSYNAGEVNGEAAVGGVVGYNSDDRVENCYYLEGTASAAIGIMEFETIMPTVLTDEQMQDSSSFVGYDFDNLWMFLDEGNYKYPVLRKSNNETAPDALTLDSKTDTAVTLVSLIGYEYKCNDSEWQMSNVFTGLLPNTEYSFYQRIAGAGLTDASISSDVLTVTTEKTTISGAVVISGAAVLGNTLTADIASVLPSSAELSYQWYRNGTPISDETTLTHTVTEEDIGNTLEIVLTGIGAYTGSLKATVSVANWIKGDIDLSGGTPTISDALVLFKHVAGVALITDASSLSVADLDGTVGVTIADALILFKYVAGVTSSL